MDLSGRFGLAGHGVMAKDGRNDQPHVHVVHTSQETRHAAVAGKMSASPGKAKCNAAFSRQGAYIGSSSIGTTGQPDIRPSDGGRDKALRHRQAVVDLGGRHGQLGHGVMAKDGRNDQPHVHSRPCCPLKSLANEKGAAAMAAAPFA